MPEGIVSFDEWSKLDLRVGQIVEVNDIDGSDKLYKLLIDIGDEKKTVCTGIKSYYNKEEILNKKIIFFVNLAPRKIMGILSEGMVLAAVNEDESKVILISPEKDIENGSRIS